MPRRPDGSAAQSPGAERPSARRNSHTSGTRGCIAISPGDPVTRPLKTAESVARDVVRDIISRELKPGDGLPSEAAMLEQYAVSRESLREGLRLLEVQGLISIRRGPGGGPVVGTVDPANLGRVSTLYYHLAGATYRELFEAWVVAESELAERAARNPDAEERLAAMGPYVGEGHAHAPEEMEKFVLLHTRFHAAIGALAKNRVMELTFQTMGQIVSHHMAVTDDPRALRDLIEEDHEKLAAAIIAGHPKRARALMKQHIQTIALFNAERIGARMDEYIEWQ